MKTEKEIKAQLKRHRKEVGRLLLKAKTPGEFATVAFYQVGIVALEWVLKDKR